MDNNKYTFEILQLVSERKYQDLRNLLEDMSYADIADSLVEMPFESTLKVFRSMSKDMSAQVFSYFDTDTQKKIVLLITNQETSDIMDELSVDDAVDFLGEMPAGVVKKILKNVSYEKRAKINRFLNYHPDSVGSIMTAEFTDIYKDMTVREAFDRIREIGEDRETVYTCYVINHSTRELLAYISAKSLLEADDDDIIADIMEENPIKAYTNDDKEYAVKLFSKYSLTSLPVVDRENRLVGIVTADDVIDVIEEESTEDIQMMAAMAPDTSPYLQSGVFETAKKRIGWLSVLMVAGMLTGSILSVYENAYGSLPLLATFIPMLTGTGGNCGAQSSTTVIRRMTVGEIEKKDTFRVIRKEFLTSLICALILSLLNFARVIIFNPQEMGVALTVSTAVFATVVLANITGALLPIIADALKIDPAVMASPVITTIVDVASLVIFFNIAMLYLGNRIG